MQVQEGTQRGTESVQFVRQHGVVSGSDQFIQLRREELLAFGWVAGRCQPEMTQQPAAKLD